MMLRAKIVATGIAGILGITHTPQIQHHLSIAPNLLQQLVANCASSVPSSIQTAVVQVESGGNAWILHDNNDGRVYRPLTLHDARSTADSLLVKDHALYGNRDIGIDVGLGQINSNNFPGLGVTAGDMFDPCRNLGVSSRMLAHAYRYEYTIFSRQSSSNASENAWDAALSMYNSGHATGDQAYIDRVRAAMGSVRNMVADSPRDAMRISSSDSHPTQAQSSEFYTTRQSASRVSGAEFYAENGSELQWQ